MMNYEDRTLKCIQCGNNFVFTAGEQMFFNDKQFKNDPKRCKECKAKHSADRRGGRRRAGTETRTQCSQCGVETTVPFRPTQGRPVLCRSCFQASAGAGKDARAAANAQDVPVELLTEADEQTEAPMELTPASEEATEMRSGN